MTSRRVAVIAGGPSSEAEVSRTSARAVAAALTSSGHAVELLELDASLPVQLAGSRFEVVFPVTHGALGEDGCLQGLLEVLGLPYVGSDVRASALAASKPHAKVQMAAAGVPVAKHELLGRDEPLGERLSALRAALGPALVFKPASGGSAIGVEIVRADVSLADMQAAVLRAFEVEPALLVEPFVPGLEVTCGVLEDERAAEALPPTLIRPRAAAHYDFISKYRAGGSEHVCPAPFDEPLNARIQRAAVAAHRALGCRDLSRVDFVVEPSAGSFVALEVNTLPGMTATSLFPEAAQVVGIPFVALCDRLLQRALARPARLAPRAPAMP